MTTHPSLFPWYRQQRPLVLIGVNADVDIAAAETLWTTGGKMVEVG